MEGGGPVTAPSGSFTPHVDPADTLWTRMQQVRTQGPVDHADLEHTQLVVQAHLDAGRPFPAMLAILEASWLHTTLPDALTGLLGALIADHPRCRSLITLLRTQVGDEVDRRVHDLEAYRPDAADRGHVLDILQATTRSNGGQDEAALARFREALAVNARLATPWHDLGFVFAGAFRFVEAYRCWDFARWISPGHASMRDVDRIDDALWTADRALAVGVFAPVG